MVESCVVSPILTEFSRGIIGIGRTFCKEFRCVLFCCLVCDQGSFFSLFEDQFSLPLVDFSPLLNTSHDPGCLHRPGNPDAGSPGIPFSRKPGRCGCSLELQLTESSLVCSSTSLSFALSLKSWSFPAMNVGAHSHLVGRPPRTAESPLISTSISLRSGLGDSCHGP